MRIEDGCGSPNLVGLEGVGERLEGCEPVAPQAFSGLADIIGEVQAIVLRLKDGLAVEALSDELQSH